MSDLFMILGLGCIGYLIWRVMTNKPIIPLKLAKKKNNDPNVMGVTKELQGDWKEIVGVKDIVGDYLIELKPEGDVRTFVGAVRTEPINYQLRSILEQEDTDRNYERLLAQLSLGPGREVELAIHVQSRPIELGDQLKQYYDVFPSLELTAQRYAQNMFFPFLEQWQSSVDEYSYVRYFFIILRYPPKLIEDLDEDLVCSKALNEYARLSSNIVSGYARMGGVGKAASVEDLLEAMYFATHKQTGKMEDIRSILNQPGRLSNIVTSDYSRPVYRFTEDELDEQVEGQINGKTKSA